MLANLSIKIKFLLPALLTSCLLLGIGLFGLSGVRQQSALINSLFDEDFTEYDETTSFATSLYRTRTGFYVLLAKVQANADGKLIGDFSKEQLARLDADITLLKKWQTRKNLEAAEK